MTVKARLEKVAPRASILIESMRDIGYSLPTAIADVIDNSITARARKVDLLADTQAEYPVIGVLDDGTGMSAAELLDAMRPGTRSPLDARSGEDLGRFGLGLKTASFSQCRRLLVLTRAGGETNSAVWDLDLVAQEEDWVVEFGVDESTVPWSERLGEHGTLVVWEKMDRLGHGKSHGRDLVRRLDEVSNHLELVFHRFLAGERGLSRVTMTLNGRALEPFDPFHSTHPATVFGPEEVFRHDGQEIRIQPVTLPHHKKVTKEEWDRYGGPEGYVKNQGFYVYRARRLIIHGTWFGLARQSELTKLSRVRIDLPNGMDSDWTVDVKKASAHPPPAVRERLKRVIKRIGEGSRRTYTSRGNRLVEGDRLPVWTRHQDKNRISYGLNLDHPVFSAFRATLNTAQQHEFQRLVDLILATLPVATFFADSSANPQGISTGALDGESFRDLVESAYNALRSTGQSQEAVELMMSAAEPYRSRWQEAKQIIHSVTKEGG